MVAQVALPVVERRRRVRLELRLLESVQRGLVQPQVAELRAAADAAVAAADEAAVLALLVEARRHRLRHRRRRRTSAWVSAARRECCSAIQPM